MFITARVGILPGLNWFCPAQWVKPGLNRIKPGLSGQNWVQHNNVHYVSSTFLTSNPVCSKQYSALYLIFHSITYL